MTERLDALTVRESNGKSYFTKIGVAFPSRNGNGYSVLLDAMPAPTEGQFKILLMEPKAKDPTYSGSGGVAGRQTATAEDDYTPF